MSVPIQIEAGAYSPIVLGSGFNAHAQLRHPACPSLLLCPLICPDTGDVGQVDILLAEWSYTIVRIGKVLGFWGAAAEHYVIKTIQNSNKNDDVDMDVDDDDDEEDIVKMFGTDLEPIGAIGKSGQVRLLQQSNGIYRLPASNGIGSYSFGNFNLVGVRRKNQATRVQDEGPGKDAEPELEHELEESYCIQAVAITKTEWVAMLLNRQCGFATPTTITAHPGIEGKAESRIVMFESITRFKSYLVSPETSQTHATHLLNQQVTQLVAGSTAFAALTRQGEVYTWGDSRLQHTLARMGPASVPRCVDHLAGLVVTKIVGQGGLFGALTNQGDVYLWGRPDRLEALVEPAGSQELDKDWWESLAILTSQAEQVSLIQEEENVCDFAVVRSGLILVTRAGRVKVVGENTHSQLGIQGPHLISTYTDIGLDRIDNVVCGPVTSFFFHRGISA